MSSVGDATTVVDGSAHYREHTNGHSFKAPIDEVPQKPRRREYASPANFATAVDYMEEERPFFVKIGKDGLIAALQKLDRQLRAVRSSDLCLHWGQ